MDAIDGITVDSYRDYGGSRAVTSLDHRVVTQLRARRYPSIYTGHWSNMAELAVGLGVGVYNVHNVEKEEALQARLFEGGLDHLVRAQFLREGFEQFKRSAGLTEIVAFPRQHIQYQRYWPSEVGSASSKEGTTVAWFAWEVVTKMVKWSWNVNDAAPGDGATLTGIRTVSSVWRTNTNTEWGNFNLRNARGNGEGGWYMKDGRENVWSSNYWVQIGEGHDDPLLDTGLFRLNLQTQSWGLTYEMHPTFQRLNGYSWVVDSTKGSRLAAVIGWAEENNVTPRDVTWGWGVNIILKDYVHDTLKTLAIHQKAKAALTGSDYSDFTLLLRGTYDDAVVATTAYYLDRPMGVDPTFFRLVASPKSAGPGGKVEIELQGEIDALRARIATLEAPRQVQQHREAWNKEDGGLRGQRIPLLVENLSRPGSPRCPAQQRYVMGLHQGYSTKQSRPQQHQRTGNTPMPGEWRLPLHPVQLRGRSLGPTRPSVPRTGVEPRVV